MTKKHLAVLGCVALAAGSAWADTHAFPSANSTVVGSVGFINEDQIGYFWSVARGDLVQEVLTDPLPSVNRAIIGVEVVESTLNSGAFVDWEVLLNGVSVDTFRVDEGFTGVVNRDVTFAAILSDGGTYTVEYRVLNEVPFGAGAHSFAYAGDFAHSITLVPAPASAALLGLGGLIATRRRR